MEASSDSVTRPSESAPLVVSRLSWRQPARWWGVAAAVLAAAVLATAASLTPAGEGLGTHRDLGLPACNWIVLMDLPCPTCGMTTSFSHTVRGEWSSAMTAQPMGVLLCLATAMIFLGGVFVAFTGAPAGRMVTSVWTRWWTWGLIGAIVFAWIWKIAVHRGMI